MEPKLIEATKIEDKNGAFTMNQNSQKQKHDYKPGDIVQLMSDSPLMTVTTLKGSDVIVAWYCPQTGHVHHDTLAWQAIRRPE